MPNRLIISGTLFWALLLGGCANHMPQRSEQETRVERKPLTHSLTMEIGEPPVLELPQRRIRINEQRTFEVTDIEVTRRYDRYTPYQPWREIYEIPFGAVALAAGLGANVLDVATLGHIPENATRDWVRYGIDGLNPFMNVESNGRSQQNLAKLEEVRRDSRLEYSDLPWSDNPVTVVVGTQSHELDTNRHGILELNLLDDPFAEDEFATVDRLWLYVEDPQDKTRAEATLGISRTLRGKLREAHALIYDDLESDDVPHWVHRIKRLGELGLDNEAGELQQSLIELTHSDPELQQEFRKLLQRRTGRIALDLPAED
ncbi:hypothetical protein [Azomonas macrocytogenes]|uniref:Lipoprotein n=1 Tax=Azomonas macrocytogenes TaxID=69962 RepID=A0A839SY30_AZOMA|nr:hypothetical protein [Azomonas macrocytogenes]MBB3102257.1 hypothetical protein [Azomonas macrocytogenes]